MQRVQGSHPHRRDADGAYCSDLPSVRRAQAIPSRGGLSRPSLDGFPQKTCRTSQVSLVEFSAELQPAANRLYLAIPDNLMLRGGCAKHPAITQAEVNQGTKQNRDSVRDKDWHPNFLDKKSQDHEISHHGNQSIRKVESHQSNQRRGIVRSVAPGVVQMPYKVVQYCKLDRRGRSH